MKRALRLAARFFPASWRAKYGVEFDCLLQDLQPRFGDVLDILRVGFRMQVTRSSIAVFAGAFAILGAVVAGATAYAIPSRYESSGILTLQTINQRPGAPVQLEVLVAELFPRIGSRSSLTRLIQRHDLYGDKRLRYPLEEVVDSMRKDIRIRHRSRGTSLALEVSYISPDPRKAQRVAQELVALFVDETLNRGSHLGVESRPVLKVIQEPTVSQTPSGPSRASFTIAGLAGGSLVGALIALLRRRCFLKLQAVAFFRPKNAQHR